MDEVKIAILKTFENTVKVLLNSNIQCVFDSDQSNDENANLEMIYDNLQGIRQEFVEIKTRLQKIESIIDTNTNKGSPWSTPLFPKNIVIELDDVNQRIVSEKKSFTPINLSEDIKKINIHNSTNQEKEPEPELEPYAHPTDVHIPDIIDEEKLKQNSINIIKKDPLVEKPQQVEVEIEEEEEGEENDEVEEENDEVEEEEEEEEEEGEEEQEQKGVEKNKQQEEDEEEQEEEEEEEEGIELEEIEFNGKTYYKDDENIVYGLDKNGEINDSPIGKWYEKAKTIKFFKV
jgi:cobalamin biosynthesis protein CobT